MTEATNGTGTETPKVRKTPVFRFKFRLSALEQSVMEVCAERGVNVEDALNDAKVKRVLVKAALESIRTEAIQERLDEDPKWLKARIAALQAG